MARVEIGKLEFGIEKINHSEIRNPASLPVRVSYSNQSVKL